MSLSYTGDALIEPGEDPEVIRAKYFIRDEFLVSVVLVVGVVILCVLGTGGA